MSSFSLLKSRKLQNCTSSFLLMIYVYIFQSCNHHKRLLEYILRENTVFNYLLVINNFLVKMFQSKSYTFYSVQCMLPQIFSNINSLIKSLHFYYYHVIKHSLPDSLLPSFQTFQALCLSLMFVLRSDGSMR